MVAIRPDSGRQPTQWELVEQLRAAIDRLGPERAKTCPHAETISQVAQALDPTPGGGGWVAAEFSSIRRQARDDKHEIMTEIKSLSGWRQWVMGGLAVLGASGIVGALYALAVKLLSSDAIQQAASLVQP